MADENYFAVSLRVVTEKDAPIFGTGRDPTNQASFTRYEAELQKVMAQRSVLGALPLSDPFRASVIEQHEADAIVLANESMSNQPSDLMSILFRCFQASVPVPNFAQRAFTEGFWRVVYGAERKGRRKLKWDDVFPRPAPIDPQSEINPYKDIDLALFALELRRELPSISQKLYDGLSLRMKTKKNNDPPMSFGQALDFGTVRKQNGLSASSVERRLRAFREAHPRYDKKFKERHSIRSEDLSIYGILKLCDTK